MVLWLKMNLRVKTEDAMQFLDISEAGRITQGDARIQSGKFFKHASHLD